MNPPVVHLVCNAHLDPVWLWEWEEGAAEALSTFRIAAEFGESREGFVFNHNEALLYRWIEEYDPALFRRIQALVRAGRWHIMGGWHLQPDCNLPSGESLVRHMLTGRRYFQEKFGVVPTTAINFDSFGHSRGLVQLMVKAGYDSYIVCRPSQNSAGVTEPDFVWRGYDGSELVVHRSDENYNSVRGKAAQEVEDWLDQNPPQGPSLFLWGIGNHGGGPSKVDLDNLRALQDRRADRVTLVHSTPEAYFRELRASGRALPVLEKSLNPVAPGCYTSQIRVKLAHRRLENQYFLTEKMASAAALAGLSAYPRSELDEALYDLMTAQFHDALPGSAIATVEEATLRLLDHGLETVSRVRARLFFALTSGQPRVVEGETPILVYNPHPYPVRGIFETELVLPSQNWDDDFFEPTVYQQGKALPSQSEDEASHFRIDWRKRAVFEAVLAPSSMNRFDCRFTRLPRRPAPTLAPVEGLLTFRTADLEVVIDAATGLLNHYRVRGQEFLARPAFGALVVRDTHNPWGSLSRYDEVEGRFSLLSQEAGSAFSGLPGADLPSVRVIEEGDVRTVVEALFGYGNSFLRLHYQLPTAGTELAVGVKVFWLEKDRMLKLSVPTNLTDGEYRGQTVYGSEALKDDGEEVAAQKWTGVFSSGQGRALTLVNDGVHGSDFREGEVRATLLRSPAYAAADFLGRPALPPDRFTDRMDQGERCFGFWLNAGELQERREAIDREALVHNEAPVLLSACPSGEGSVPPPAVVLSDPVVQLGAFKKAEGSEDYVLRLFEPTGQPRSTQVSLPGLGLCEVVRLGAFEVKSLRVDRRNRRLVEVSLIEG